MNDKVLVAYATKYGATREIAERIGTVLRGAGLEVDVAPADRAGDVSQFAAVVLGSAAYIGAWRKAAVAFLRANEAALAQRPVWLFSSGPLGAGDPAVLTKGWRFPANLQAVADRIKPRDIAIFHGAIDLQKLNPLERWIVIKGAKAPAGDFRDWKGIESWASGIAEALKSR